MTNCPNIELGAGTGAGTRLGAGGRTRFGARLRSGAGPSFGRGGRMRFGLRLRPGSGLGLGGRAGTGPGAPFGLTSLVVALGLLAAL